MTKLAIDVEEAEADLDVVINDVIVTTFHLSSGQVVLDARPTEISVTNAEFSARLLQIKNWIGIIDSMIRPTYLAKVKHKLEYKKTNIGFEAQYTLTSGTNVTVTNAEHDYIAKTTLFAPRVEITLGWSDFVGWINFLSYCYNETSAF